MLLLNVDINKYFAISFIDSDIMIVISFIKSIIFVFFIKESVERLESNKISIDNFLF